MNEKTKQERFMALLEPHLSSLSAFAFSKARSRESAKELVSETILAAYEAFDNLKNDEAFLSFIFTIASRKYAQELKYRYSHNDLNSFDFDLIYSNNVSPEDSLDVQSLYEEIYKLPEKSSEAIILFEIHGFSIKEIAEIQNSTVFSVKMRLMRARNSLKKAFVNENVLEHDLQNSKVLNYG